MESYEIILIITSVLLGIFIRLTLRYRKECKELREENNYLLEELNKAAPFL